MKVLEFIIDVFFRPRNYRTAVFTVVIYTIIIEIITLLSTGTGLFQGLLLDAWGMSEGLATLTVIAFLLAAIGVVGTLGKMIFKKK